MVGVSWSAPSGATGYNLYWSTSPGVTNATGIQVIGVTSPYSHDGLTNGAPVYYVVTATSGDGESAVSAQVTATPSTAAGYRCPPASYSSTTFTYSQTSIAAVTGTTAIPIGSRISVTLPEAVAVGIAVVAADLPSQPYAFIEHGELFGTQTGAPNCMLTSAGNAPLAFNRIDFTGNGVETPAPDSVNYEAAATLFPNDGSQLTLPAGVYSFPIGALDSNFYSVSNPSLTPYVYYKVPTETRPTLKLNVFVALGVRPGITDAASAAADPEIVGAINVLRNVYENNANTDITLAVTVATVPSSYVTLTWQWQMDALLSSYPDPSTHDAMNIFIVGSLQFMDDASGGNVVGLAAGLPGPFNIQGTKVSGTLAEYQGDYLQYPPGDPRFGTILGFILAHEFGHFLGLYHTSQTDSNATSIIGHDPIADTPRCTTADLGPTYNLGNCPDRTNLMFPYVDDNPNPPLTPMQGTVIRLNPAVTP